MEVKGFGSARKQIEETANFLNSLKKFHQGSGDDESNLPETPPPSENLSLSFRGKNDWPSASKPDFSFTPGTPFRNQFITFVEVFYFTSKRLPSKREVEAKFGKIAQEDWEQLIVETQDSLSNRGILSYSTPVGFLQPNFVLAVNLMCAVQDRRSVEAKLKEAGISTKQWQSLLRRQEYYDYYQRRVNEIFTEDVKNDCKLGLAELVAARDLAAIKYVNELTNVYRPQGANELIMKMLQVIIEIVSMHVTPDVLSKIANDLQNSEIINVKETHAISP